MAVVKELIRTNEAGEISFGDYSLEKKTKLEDFECNGDIYKVKTFHEITKLEKNGMFVYESVPGTAVENLSQNEHGMEFVVEGPEDAQITIELEDDMEYKIYQYVNAHFTDYDLSIENVADTLHTSTAAVRAAIFKYTGKMYKNYLIYLRIEYAKQLLSSEDITIAETCRKIGYSNLSYFTKLFKETTGITPTQYQKNFLR